MPPQKDTLQRVFHHTHSSSSVDHRHLIKHTHTSIETDVGSKASLYPLYAYSVCVRSIMEKASTAGKLVSKQSQSLFISHVLPNVRGVARS